MLDLSLTTEQEELRECVRAFVDERILPVAGENEMQADHAPGYRNPNGKLAGNR